MLLAGAASVLLGECKKGCAKRKMALRGRLSALMDELGEVLESPGQSPETIGHVRQSLEACALMPLDTEPYLEKAITLLESATVHAKKARRAGTVMGLLGAVQTRASCLECVEKHLGSAWVLITETRNGYPHRMFAVGHLHEAEDESQAYPELHTAIRDARKAYQTAETLPDWPKIRALLEKARNG
jgi:hypothetical protein